LKGRSLANPPTTAADDRTPARAWEKTSDHAPMSVEIDA
jgi:endonuclease/exonuclease/phosphatase family metal-dependent hydrolase